MLTRSIKCIDTSALLFRTKFTVPLLIAAVTYNMFKTTSSLILNSLPIN